MVDVGHFLGRAVLAPGDRTVALEDQRGVRQALLHEPALERVALRTLTALGAVGVEPDSPAATEDPVVTLDQRRKGVPRLGRGRPDREVVHRLRAAFRPRLVIESRHRGW